VKTSFPAYARAHQRRIGVVTLGFIQNTRAVLLLAACRTPKSDRLLEDPARDKEIRDEPRTLGQVAKKAGPVT
jgi:hypothetical protein